MKTNTKLIVASFATTLLSSTLLCGGHDASTTQRSGEPAAPIRLASGQWTSTIQSGFVPNLGQVPGEAVKFVLRGDGVSAHFTESGFVLWNGQATTVSRDGIETQVPVAPRWSLAGAQAVEPIGGETFAHTISFFRGNDPAKWRANVPAHREIIYPEVLKGVEMRVESRERGFEYTFHIKPHAKPDLRFRYDGILALEEAPFGDLIVRTAKGHFTESRPVSFQLIDGTKRAVESSFEIISTNEYRIALGPYDARHELVIDPVLDWSTFLGGSYVERIRQVGTDPSGNVVAAGDMYSPNFPGAAGFSTGPGAYYDWNLNLWYEDVVVAKFTPDGTQLLWAGYLAGDGLTGDTIGPRGFAVNPAGDLYLTGITDSPDFPVTGGPAHSGLSDGFVAKIKGDGSAILWSTFLGGSNEDWGTALALDAQENVFVTGLTRSANFPVLNAFDSTLGGVQDAFVARFDSEGQLLWSSYFGGNLGEDRAAALTVDATPNLFLFGNTESSDFPATVGDTILDGDDDAFVAKLDGNGTGVIWSTLLGGSNKEHDFAVPTPTLNNLLRLKYPRGDIALDSAGNIFVAGQTYSADFPTTPGAFDRTLGGLVDGYVAKLASNGASLIWATYLGGSAAGAAEMVVGLALNSWDEIFVTGRTDSPDYPVTAGAFQTTFQGGGQDAFVAQFGANGALLYSSFLGGSQSSETGLGIAYSAGNVFVTGWSVSGGFPTTAGTYQSGCPGCPGYSDGFVIKFLDAFLAHDGFESGTYSGGSGWAGNWTTSGDTSILTSSGPHAGTRHVRLRSKTGNLRRSVNIPGTATSVRLGFWTKVNSFEGSDRAYVRVKKSTSGTFTTVLTFTPAQSDNKYHYYEIDLTSFLPASQLQVEFDAEMNATNDNWYLDDIRFVGTE